jgi:hypothetical protein
MKPDTRNLMKSLRLLAAVALLLAATPGWATTTSGILTSNETWAGSVTPTGDVTVPTNLTLTILSGTRVECWDYFDDQGGGVDNKYIKLIVNAGGVLNALGASNNPSVFTSAPVNPPAKRGDWYGLRFLASSNGASVLKHCVVDYGRVGCDLRAPLLLPAESCNFREKLGSGLLTTFGGTFENCRFQSNNGHGFEDYAGSGIAVHFTNCVASGNDGMCLAEYQGILFATSCSVINNTSDGLNTSGGGYWNGAEEVTLTSCIFANNHNGVVGSHLTAKHSAFTRIALMGLVANMLS